MPRILAAAAAAGLLLLLAPSSARADLRQPPPLNDPRHEGVELNSWLTLKPYLRFTTTATTNLFQESNARNRQVRNNITIVSGGKESDTVFRTMPGFDLIAEREDVASLSIGYVPTIVMYARNGDLNTVVQNVRYGASLTLDKLEIKSSGVGTWGVTPSDPVFQGRIRNFTGNANISVDYDFTDLIGALVEGSIIHNYSFPHVLRPAANTAEWRQDSFVTISPNVGHELTFLVGGGWREWHYVDERAIRPDISWMHFGGGVDLKLGDLLDLNGRGFFELGTVKKRRAFSRRLEVHDSFLGQGNATLHLFKILDLSVFGSFRTEAAAQADYRWTTVAGGGITLTPIEDLVCNFTASYVNQNPRQVAELYLESYLLVVEWFALEHVSFGGQIGYTRAHLRTSGYEVFHGGLSITLQL